MITAWRLVHRRRADEAFSGMGSRRYGGRWNPKGIAVVYVSDSLALATLEIIVHAAFYPALRDHVSIKVEFPESLVTRVTETVKLPKNWRNDPPPRKLLKIGEKWFRNRRSAILKVPSAVIPVESNYVLNPEHPEFEEIMIHPAKPFEIDARLTAKDRNG